jgi:hypothetical protein
MLVCLINFMKEAKKPLVEFLLGKIVMADKVDTFLHIFKILKLVLCKTELRKPIVEFFSVKSAEEGSIPFKTTVFKFMREFKGELEQDCMESLKDYLSFDTCLK